MPAFKALSGEPFKASRTLGWWKGSLLSCYDGIHSFTKLDSPKASRTFLDRTLMSGILCEFRVETGQKVKFLKFLAHVQPHHVSLSVSLGASNP